MLKTSCRVGPVCRIRLRLLSRRSAREGLLNNGLVWREAAAGWAERGSVSEVNEQESIRTKHQQKKWCGEASKLRFLHMVNTAKSRGTNDTWEAGKAIIWDPDKQ